MGIVFGEDKGFGNVFAARKEVGEKGVFEGANDSAYLVGGDDIAVELIGGIVQFVVERLPAAGAGFAVATINMNFDNRMG